MLSFGLRNVRALKDVKPVEIKPITLLVGRNSSGKSSYLRSFPLLRQSINTRTSAPVLWFGDLVDFGDYKTAVTDNSIDDNVEFRFGIDQLDVNIRTQYFFDQGSYEATEGKQFSARNVQVDFSIAAEGNASRIATISVSSKEDRISAVFKFAERNRRLTGLEVNGIDYIGLFSSQILEMTTAGLFGHMTAAIVDQQRRLVRSRVPLERVADRVLRAELANWMKPYVHGRTQERTRQRWSSVILRLPTLSLPDLSKLRQNSGNASFASLISRLAKDPSNPTFNRLHEIYNLSKAISIYDAAVDHLSTTFSTVQYIGPVRTRNERYYRYQDLAVSEIDPDARNFPMFLNSLTSTQIDRFSSWVLGIFHFGVKVSRKEGHISINVVQADKDVNVVDTGYGVSQVLPILGQIWWAKYGSGRSRPGSTANSSSILLTIEQPELHLHPAHQALLADALVGALKQQPSDPEIRFVIETHSEALVNRLGEFIQLGRLERESVSVVLFGQSAVGGKSSVSISSFGEEGELRDWPFGFFQPEPVL